MYPKSEVKQKLESTKVLLAAITDCVEAYPNLKPTAIAKMLSMYQSRLKEEFDIVEGE